MCLVMSLSAIALSALSGVPGLAFGRRSQRGQEIATLLSIVGALLGAVAALVALSDGRVETLTLAGPLAALPLHLRMDPLTAFFLLPVFVLGGAGALYGARYWRQVEHPENGLKVRLCWGLLIASLAAVLVAADAVAFLLAWEVMALSAFLLVSTEDERAEVRQAGWVYLVATHAGTLALFALFGLLWAVTGSLELRALPSDASRPGVTGVLFLFALLGFGLKAGIVPLHFWLPAAHAHAPSHVSALLSGVVLKMGIYGLLRVLTLVPAPPPAVGLLLLAAGAGSAVYGVLFALGQHDLKRLLAYHSIENIGIIVMGLGLALIGLGAGQPAWLALGLGGCLLHVWNHALFKGLLFLARRIGDPCNRHPGDRSARRARQADGGHRDAVRGRRRGDLRPAAAQRLRERAADLRRPAPGDRRRRRRCLVRGAPRRSPARHGGGARDRMLREGVRYGVPRTASFGSRRARP